MPMPLHPYFGTVLILAILLGLCLVVTLVNAVLDCAEKIATRRIRKADDAALAAENNRYTLAADDGPGR